jgi:predicted nicotinamide N-methyase
VKRSIAETEVPGGWCEREIVVGERAFRLLSPTDPDCLLEDLEEPSPVAPQHFVDPYWAKIWPAAPALAAAILRSTLLPGPSVLELGCGSGLAGIAALAAGLDVTFSDYVPLAVELAKENAARNGYSGAAGMILDWRAPKADRFPLIIGADVTYDRSHFPALLGVVDAMLAAAGEAWFGDAGRGPAEEFVRRALERGWKVSRFDANDRPVTDFVLARFQRIVLRRA